MRNNRKKAITYLMVEGKALKWHTTLTNFFPYSSILSWSDFTKRLIERFGNICDDPMVELMRLRQRHLVNDYHEEFN